MEDRNKYLVDDNYKDETETDKPETTEETTEDFSNNTFKSNEEKANASEKVLSEEKSKKLERKALIAKITNTICNIVLCVLVAFLICTKLHIIGLYTVSGSSMKPTIQDGERTISTNLKQLEYGDIVYVDTTEEFYGHKLIKRLIGMPGDTLTFTKSTVSRNGVLLEEPYLKDTPDYTMFYDTCLYGEKENGVLTFTLGEDQYFVMGDNRNHSSDSRHIEIGPVSKKQILGTYVLTFGHRPDNTIEFSIEDFENME